MMGMRPSVVRDDWTFEVSGLTEAVRLNVGFEVPGGGWSVRHAWKDNVDLLDTAVDIAPGRPSRTWSWWRRQITELSGLVNDFTNQTVTDASVVVFSEDKERWTTGSRYLRVTRPDTNGKYTVRLTPAQNYRVVVVQGLEDGQSSDPEFLTRALDYATPFDIGEGEAKLVNLKLVKIEMNGESRSYYGSSEPSRVPRPREPSNDLKTQANPKTQDPRPKTQEE